MPAQALVDASPFLRTAFWFVLPFWVVIILIPIFKVLKRTGHAPVWSILFVIPLVNVAALWVFAFKSWPIDRRPSP